MRRHGTRSRRRFLKETVAVLGAAAIPALIPRTVLADGDSPGANDRVGIGYIGVGRRAGQLLGLPKDAEIRATADVYLDRAKQVAEQLKAQHAFGDYRKMLELKEVDAVVIATPDHWHALPFIHACQAEKDVYCEKPLSLTVREGRAMVDAARKYKRVCQTGTQQRSYVKNDVACRLLREGRFGKVSEVIGNNYPSPWNCAFPSLPAPESLDWDMWCGQTQPRGFHPDLYPCRAKPGWLSFTPYSGGEMTGWGAHGLDQIQCALGMDETGPVEIWAEGGKLDPPTYDKPQSLEAGDKATSEGRRVFYKYSNGVLVTLDNGNGAGGTFITDKGKVVVARDEVSANPGGLLEESGFNAAVAETRLPEHLEDWINCIKSRGTPIADVAVSHRSVSVCHLANIARWTGRRLQWDAESEQFKNDPEANGYLEREQRPAYRLPDSI